MAKDDKLRVHDGGKGPVVDRSDNSSGSGRSGSTSTGGKGSGGKSGSDRKSKAKRPKAKQTVPPPLTASLPIQETSRNKANVSIEVARIASSPSSSSQETFVNRIHMPPHIPHPLPDTYHCISQRTPKDLSHMVSFRPLDEEGHIHHLILFACEEPWQPKEGQYWDCLSLPVCKSRSLLAYAWALRAPPLTLPENVGYVVGGDTIAKYFVLQIHFKNPSPGVPVPVGLEMTLKAGSPKKYVGMFLMIGVRFVIPPQTPEYHVSLGCDFNYEEDVHFFGYRTHAHYLGREITGTLGREGTNTTIALRSAQQPQTFILMENDIDVKRGDRMTADCMYNSMKKAIPTGVGSKSTDEMCNLYFMFWTETPSQASLTCVGNGPEANFDDFHSSLSGAPQSSVWEGDEMQIVEQPLLTLPQDTQLVAIELTPDYILTLHRGGREWDATTYTPNHKLIDEKPISRAVISITNRKDGTLVSEWGENLFYMPHGFLIDQHNNWWITDCGSHQVYKYVNFELMLSLGTPFEPGHDHSHFCKPTDVLILADLSILVSDGYCNSRVMHFAPDGLFLEEILLPAPRGGAASLPHSMALNRETHEVYVADRENGRILKVAGSPTQVTELIQLRSSVFALAFSSAAGGILAAVTHSKQDPNSALEVFTVKSGAEKPGTELLRVKDGESTFKGLFLHDITLTSTTDDKGEAVTVQYFIAGKEFGPPSNTPSLVRVSHDFKLKAVPISTLAGVAMEAGSHVGVVD